MSDQHPPEPHASPGQPVPPLAGGAPTDQTTEPSASGRPSWLTPWRSAPPQRAGRTRTGVVLAVAGALLVGGAGGFAVGALATGEPAGDPGDWAVHHGRLDEDRQGPPPGAPGQLPPVMRDDDSGTDG